MKSDYSRSEVVQSEDNRSVLRRVIGVIFWVLIGLLIFRMIFMLFGANPDNAFVNIVYVLTGWLVVPFNSIFPDFTIESISAGSVFEPGALIAIVVLVLVWALISYLIGRGSKRVVEHESVEDIHVDRH